MYKQILIDAKVKTGKRGQKQSWLGEVHQGGEGQHWTIVLSKKKNSSIVGIWLVRWEWHQCHLEVTYDIEFQISVKLL